MEKVIKDYPAYKISDDSKVYTCFKPKTSIMSDTWRELKQIYDKSCGYKIVTLCDGNGRRQNKRVHRLLMEAFVPNPNNYPQINHIDGNKLNNTLSNLEWCSSKHNTSEAIRLGLTKERDDKAKVCVIQLDLCGNFIQEHVSLHDAGRNTNTCWQNIFKVCKGIRKSAGGFKWKYKY